jgi:hypothetical protein
MTKKKIKTGTKERKKSTGTTKRTRRKRKRKKNRFGRHPPLGRQYGCDAEKLGRLSHCVSHVPQRRWDRPDCGGI